MNMTERNTVAEDGYGPTADLLHEADRDRLADVIMDHAWTYPDSFCECNHYVDSNGTYAYHVADALAPVVAEFRDAAAQAARAEALTEAADAVKRVREGAGIPDGMLSHPVAEHFEKWLRDRAALDES